ncbi:autophagy protein atg9 [Coemansia sp. RSA 564]|nr:autophagy protein atg9 [Coemansia sp. RSA 564]KAJ2282934.1 autophagy protein atg9 [Coemansia sp. RSA 370]KAJ2407119.1 autophagy protein atg9 [Coemansia sp. RSA 2526]
MDSSNNNLYNDDNAWSTVMTTMPSGSGQERADEEQLFSAATAPVTTAHSTPPNEAPTAQTRRGLTSTLSGRRQRHESAPEHPSSTSPASTVPDSDATGHQLYTSMHDSQVLVGTPVLSARRDSGRGARALSPHTIGRHPMTRTRVDDVDDEDVPPASLLIELPEESPPGRRMFGETEQPQQGGAHGPSGFVRRAAHAVQHRIQDISGQAAAAALPRLGGPMPPPPRHRSREFGDGNIYTTTVDSAWPRRRGRTPKAARLSYRERALRAWRDARHQDDFFCRVYAYYVGKGALTIILSRVLQLATLAFVVVLSTFVFGCIDHAKVREQKSLSAVVIPQCTQKLTWPVTLALWSSAAFWMAQVVRTALDVPMLLEIRAFFVEVLDVQAADIGTIAWHEVVERMVRLRDAEIREYRGMTKSRVLAHRLTADGIVNRIMRRENYMVALFNKDVLDISVPGLSKTQALSKALEWNLSFCLMNYVFDERGQLRRRFLKESNRAILSEGLRRRFRFMAVINMMFAPFIVIFLVLYSFFRYFEELYHEPGTLMSRAFTPYAKYKFRNFNEVPHSFRRRLNSAHPKATLYLGQFRNDAMIAVARFVSFVAGSFTALLLVFAVVDNELSLEFEITKHRTVLFYIGLWSAVLASARGMVPTDEQEYLHPAWIIRDALEDLQYMDPEWRGRLDTTRVRREFEVLFSYKLLIFAHELLGVVTAPFIMLVSLPGCAEKVVDFFREFTVHKEGLGYVCSFAVFDFEKHGNVEFAAPARAGTQRLASKHGKMEQSFLAFKADYPGWQPRDPAGSIFLQRAQNAQQDLWRMGSVVSGAGWQDRLLQQQRMAGSVLPTGASLYRPRNIRGIPGAPPVPGSGNNGSGNNGPGEQHYMRSQYAFQPPGFNGQPSGFSPQQNPQSLASQALLPFGPTLGEAGKGKQTEDVDRLALSALPLVASPNMGSSLNYSVMNGRAPHAGMFSVLNELYEQQLH